MATKSIVPRADSEGSIGTTIKRWATGFFDFLTSSKGADVASATALPLISDGNSVDVTGTTTITSMDSVSVGATMTLQFDGALTLTHHATDLILPGGANITTAAGDIGVFTEYATGDWRCVSYTKADGTPIAGSAEAPLALTTADNANTIGLTVTNNDVTNNPTSATVVNAGAGNGLFIDQNGNGTALNIDSEATSAVGLRVDCTPLTAERALYVYGNAANTYSWGFSTVHQDHASTTAPSFHSIQDGTSTRSPSIFSENRHASYAGRCLEVDATRAASSAYKLAAFSSGALADVEFYFSGDGNGTCDGSWTGGGADFAELKEWLDGNPYDEDRRGYSVSMVGTKIKIAEEGEVVIGVISGRPAVIGNNDMQWRGKYLVDDFGTRVLEDYEVWSWSEMVIKTVTRKVKGPDGVIQEVELDEEVEDTHNYAFDAIPDDVIVPTDHDVVVQQREKLNPAFDPAADHTPRLERKEWGIVGLLGEVSVRKGQAVDPRWIKMRDISETIEEWLVR